MHIVLIALCLLWPTKPSDQLVFVFSNNVKLQTESTSALNVDSIEKVIEYASIENSVNDNKCTSSADCNAYFKVCFSSNCIIKRCFMSINCPDDSYCNEAYRICFPKEFSTKTDSGSESPESETITKMATTKISVTTKATTTTSTVSRTTKVSEIVWLNFTKLTNDIKGIFADNTKYQQNIQVNNHSDSSALLW
jgi:hypothetical protein